MKQFLRLPRREILVIAGACLAAFLVTIIILSYLRKQGQEGSGVENV